MKIKTVLVAAALVGSGLAAPMTAQASLSQCSSNYMCVWGNTDYIWLIAKQYHGNQSWVDPFSGDEDNQADSYANYSGTYTGCLAQDLNGGGGRVSMPRGGRDSNLAVWNDNEASSMRTAYGC